jgi:neutral ceramidase
MNSLLLVGSLVLTVPAPLQAGAATSNITPPLGTRIVGGFAPYPAEHIHDELHARCLVLDDGQTRLALVVCDLLGLHRSVSVEARRLIEKETGIPPQNVLISATHTHSAGTALGHNRYANEQELDDYQRFVARRIADGVRRALNLLRPAEIAFTRVDVPEQVHNRRWLMREGTVPPNPFGKIDRVRMNPPVASPDLIEPAGPVDPAVSIIALREPDGRLISAYCAYSLHYVGGSGPAHVSADYFGMFCEALKRRQPGGDADPPFVALLANGTSGDINNIDRLNPRGSRVPYQRMREVAEDVAGKVQAALDNIPSWQDRVTLDARARELQLDWRTVEPELLEWAKAWKPRRRASPAATSRSAPSLRPSGIGFSGSATPVASSCWPKPKDPRWCRCKCCGSATSPSAPARAKRSPKSAWSSHSAARCPIRSWSRWRTATSATCPHRGTSNWAATRPGPARITWNRRPRSRLLDALIEMTAEIAPQGEAHRF